MAEKDKAAAAATEVLPVEAAADVGTDEDTASSTPKRRKRIIIGAAAAVAVLVLVGAGTAVALSQGTPGPAGPAPAVQAEEEAGKKSTVLVTLGAEGAEDAPVKAKVKVTGKDGKDAIAERGVNAGKAVEIGKLAKGDYTLTVTAAPVLEDGTTYTLPEKPSAIKVDGKGGAVEVEVVLEKVAAEDMDADALAEAADALADAGDTGAAEAVAGRAKDAPPAPSGGGGAAPGSGGSGSDGSGGGSGGSSSSPAPEKPAAPAHTHSWQEVTEWVPNIVTVVDKEAYSKNEPILGSKCTCGTVVSSGDAWPHQQQHLVNGETGFSIQTGVVIGHNTVHVPAVTHTEDQGSSRVVGYTCACGAAK